MPDAEVRHFTASLTDGTTYQVPYWEVRAAADGPCLLVTAALHGNEIQGVEVLRRLLPTVRDGLRCGACLFVPMANVMAVRRRQPHIDFEVGRYYGRDNVNNVNCAWPGKTDGSNGQRLAHAFHRDLLPQATHLVDLHCYSRCWAAIVYARAGHEPSLALARACGLRFAAKGTWKPDVRERPVFPCTLENLFDDTGRAGVSIELSGQYGYWEPEVRRGARAVLNCLRLLRMLPGEIERDEPLIWLSDANSVKCVAPHSGLFAPADIALGDPVEEGAVLGHVLSDRDLHETPIRAPARGFLYQMGPIRGGGMNDIAADPLTMLHPYAAENEVVAAVATDSCERE
jgi:predicted deacylase